MLRVHSFRNYNDNEAAKKTDEDISQALQAHGFVLINGVQLFEYLTGGLYGMSRQQYDASEKRRFVLSKKTKNRMKSTPAFNFYENHAGFSVRQDDADDSPIWPHGPFQTYFDMMSNVGFSLLLAINTSFLRHPVFWPPSPFSDERQNVFPDGESLMNWIDAVEDSKSHVLSAYRFQTANTRGEFHVGPHVNKGALTIFENPDSMEIFVRDQWIEIGPRQPGTFAILAGRTLECATGGLFRAAKYRVRNNGDYQSRVMKIRFDPNLKIYPNSVVGLVDSNIRDPATEDPLPNNISVKDIIDSIDSSKEPRNKRRRIVYEQPAPEKHFFCENGNFRCPDPEALSKILEWLDPKDLLSVGRTCWSLRKAAGQEHIVVPAAEKAGWLWDVGIARVLVPSFTNLRSLTPHDWLLILAQCTD